MANIKLSTIEERLERMRRVGNQWAELYIRDVSHLLKLLKATPTPDLKQRARVEWQPIETAPKTGERILIAHGNSVQESEWFSPEQRWWNTEDDEVFTHWMPLPDPPDATIIERHFTASDVEQETT